VKARMKHSFAQIAAQHHLHLSNPFKLAFP